MRKAHFRHCPFTMASETARPSACFSRGYARSKMVMCFSISTLRSVPDSQLAAPVKERFGQEAEPLYPRIAKYFQVLESYGFVNLRKKED